MTILIECRFIDVSGQTLSLAELGDNEARTCPTRETQKIGPDYTAAIVGERPTSSGYEIQGHVAAHKAAYRPTLFGTGFMLRPERDPEYRRGSVFL
jgi:hypothetical protein